MVVCVWVQKTKFNAVRIEAAIDRNVNATADGDAISL